MRIHCDGCQHEIEVPSDAKEGYTFECPNWAATTLRVRRDPLRLEIVPRASCPETGAAVLLPDDVRHGDERVFSCGHLHRATFEYGAWALE